MTISEIKGIITDSYIKDETIRSLYGLDPNKTFDEQFSKVSLESILFFAVATGIWIACKMFDQHKIDIFTILRDNRAHTTGWYAARSKEFQFGRDLVNDNDFYDNSGLNDEQIEKLRVVKFAVANETNDSALMYLKIATESAGKKQPLNDVQLAAFTNYIGKIKDAGVRIKIVNEPADELRLKMDIYYNPLVLDISGKRVDGVDDTPIQLAIKQYIGNLAFNGFYANQTLVDTIQQVDGVEIVELKEASSKYGNLQDFIPINARSIPRAGYYQISDPNLILNFIANE